MQYDFFIFFDFIDVLFRYGGESLAGGWKDIGWMIQVRERLNESTRLVSQKKENSRRKEEDKIRKLKNVIDISGWNLGFSCKPDFARRYI